jgi:hypothetical protein
MLVELAAFNAAYATVKAALGAGREISAVARHIGIMIGSQETLQARGERKKNNPFAKLLGKEANDFEEFMHIEEMKRKRAELLEIMTWYGRAGLTEDFLRFEAEGRKQRRAEAKAAEEYIAKLQSWAAYTLFAVIICGGLAGLYYFADYLKGLK